MKNVLKLNIELRLAILIPPWSNFVAIKFDLFVIERIFNNIANQTFTHWQFQYKNIRFISREH